MTQGEAGDRKMVELEAAELTAARVRNEKIAKRMNLTPRPSSAPSPAPLREARHHLNPKKNVDHGTATTTKSDELPKYDTTPKIPPGLGGERWETWRHLPTVMSPRSGGSCGVADNVQLSAPSPPSPPPVVVAPTVSVSSSSSSFLPSKLFTPSSAAADASAAPPPPPPPPSPPKLGKVTARTYAVDTTNAARGKADKRSRSLFGRANADGSRFEGDDPRAPASSAKSSNLPATVRPSAGRPPAAAQDEEDMAALSSARKAASTDEVKAADDVAAKKKKTRATSSSSSSTCSSEAVGASAAAELMARTLQSMPVQVVQESARVVTEPDVVIGITAVERKLDPNFIPAAAAATQATAAQEGWRRNETKRKLKNAAAEDVVPAKAETKPTSSPPPQPPLAPSELLPPSRKTKKPPSGVTFVWSGGVGGSGAGEKAEHDPSAEEQVSASRRSRGSGATFGWSGRRETKRTRYGAPAAESHDASTARSPPVAPSSSRGDVDGGGRGRRIGGGLARAPRGAVGRGGRTVAGAFGSGVMALGRVTGKATGAVWSVVDAVTDVAAAAVEGGVRLTKDGWDLVTTGVDGRTRTRRSSSVGDALHVGMGNGAAASEWIRRAAVVVQRHCCSRDFAWNVEVPSALSVQLGTPRRRSGGGWFRILRGGRRGVLRSSGGSSAAESKAAIEVPVDAAEKPRVAKWEELEGGVGLVFTACGSTVFVSSLDEVIEAGSVSARKTITSAARSVASAARSVQKKLESAFADEEEEKKERGRGKGAKSSKEENEDVYYDDEESTLPPTGSYEDLEGFTHFIAEPDSFPVPAELDHVHGATASPARSALAPSPLPLSKHRRPPVLSPSPPQEPRSLSSLSPLPPRLVENLPLFRPAPARASRRREPSAETKNASTPRKEVSLRQVRLANYEDSLAARVRTIQRTFPEVATEIADAVYAFAGEMKSLSVRATVAAKGMTRKPVDIQAAVRVVEELEAATMSVLMHGKTPTGANFRSWLTELVEGRGVGRGERWQNEHSPFFSSQPLAQETDAATFRENRGAGDEREDEVEDEDEEEASEDYEGMVETQSVPIRADDEEREKVDRLRVVAQELPRVSAAAAGVGPIASAAAAAANRMFDESFADASTPEGRTAAAETLARHRLSHPELNDEDEDEDTATEETRAVVSIAAASFPAAGGRKHDKLSQAAAAAARRVASPSSSEDDFDYLFARGVAHLNKKRIATPLESPEDSASASPDFEGRSVKTGAPVADEKAPPAMKTNVNVNERKNDNTFFGGYSRNFAERLLLDSDDDDGGSRSDDENDENRRGDTDRNYASSGAASMVSAFDDSPPPPPEVSSRPHTPRLLYSGSTDGDDFHSPALEPEESQQQGEQNARAKREKRDSAEETVDQFLSLLDDLREDDLTSPGLVKTILTAKPPCSPTPVAPAAAAAAAASTAALASAQKDSAKTGGFRSMGPLRRQQRRSKPKQKSLLGRSNSSSGSPSSSEKSFDSFDSLRVASPKRAASPLKPANVNPGAKQASAPAFGGSLRPAGGQVSAARAAFERELGRRSK